MSYFDDADAQCRAHMARLRMQDEAEEEARKPKMPEFNARQLATAPEECCTALECQIEILIVRIANPHSLRTAALRRANRALAELRSMEFLLIVERKALLRLLACVENEDFHGARQCHRQLVQYCTNESFRWLHAILTLLILEVKQTALEKESTERNRINRELESALGCLPLSEVMAKSRGNN